MLIATKLPIEIINKILIYVGELNNEVIIEQYNATNCFYKINFYADFLWELKGLILMKRFYPALNTPITNYIDLYKMGKNHYKREFKSNNTKY